MAANERYFVEWKEQYVSKERGNRVVHYFLKDNSGELIRAVVGTERSVRHMFYVVAEEFLSVYGAENSIHAGFRWRSRREVVNWLTSMLSKQHRQGALSQVDLEVNPQQAMMPSYKGRLARNLKGHGLGISWSGLAWSCGKQLKHYPAFSRNGISISVHSFVFVMAEKEKPYIAYLEDMYEDRKCQKKVKVRWFHQNTEVKGVSSLRDVHPGEVFITPYAQVISAECVDGPAIVLTREHYEKCMAVLPPDLLGRVHFCFRQFKNNRLKPFKLSKLRGYSDQSIFSCFSPDFFEDEKLSSGEDVKVGAKRNRSCLEHRNQKGNYGRGREQLRPVEGQLRHNPIFVPNDKVEFLCQDSGIRGCWFRCTVSEVSKRQTKILYDDIKDEDSCDNLEEWVPTYRVAKPDKLGMRHPGRPTIRPADPCDKKTMDFKVGDPADAWWSDGWWEGVITCNYTNGNYQVYVPGEGLYLDMELKDLRVSRDWVGDRWMDVKPNPNVLCTIPSTVDTKFSVPAASKDAKSSPTFTYKLSTVEEEIHDLEGMTLTNVPLRDGSSYEEEQALVEAQEREFYSEQANEENGEDNVGCEEEQALVEAQGKEFYSEQANEENDEDNVGCDTSGADILNNTLNQSVDCDKENNADIQDKSVERDDAEPKCEVETMEAEQMSTQ